MDFGRFFTILLSELFLIPAGIMVLVPMKNQLRYEWKRVLFRVLSIVIILLPLGALIQYYFDVAPDLVIFPIILISFIIYRFSITATLAQASAVTLFVGSFMSVASNLARVIDSRYHPNGGAHQITLEFGLYRLAISTLFLLLFYHVLNKYLSFLIDQMKDPKVWWVRASISAILLLVNASMAPLKYETLYVNNILRVFLCLQLMIFVLEIMIGTTFIYIINNLISLSELQLRSNLMEMQENAYEKQQRYMEENARIRHDFKHTIRSLKIMAEEGDLEGVNRYLDEYVRALPENEIRIYCKNNALNAMLNYYRNQAVSRNIEVKYAIELPPPDHFALSNTELCSMIGNILENAIRAATAQKEGERYIRLTLRVEHEQYFYIVAVNSFDGNPVIRGGRYISTRKKDTRTGIGLSSIASIVDQHHGIARFYHEGTEFFTDIMIPASTPTEILKYSEGPGE